MDGKTAGCILTATRGCKMEIPDRTRLTRRFKMRIGVEPTMVRWRAIRRALAAAVAVVSLGAQAEATVILIVRTKSEIVVAADGMLRQFRGGQVGAAGNICKIEQIGGVLAMTSGVASAQIDGKEVDFDALLQLAAAEKGTLERKLEAFEKLSAEQLGKVLQRLMVSSLKDSGLTVALGAIEDGRTRWVRRRYVADDKGEVRCSLSLESAADLPAGMVECILLGPVPTEARVWKGWSEETFANLLGGAEIARDPRRLLALPAPSANLDGIPLRAYAFIHRAIVEEPTHFGYPISVVRLDSKGVSWLERGACQLPGPAGAVVTQTAQPAQPPLANGSPAILEQKALVKVESEPPGALVTIGELVRGQSPVTVELMPGEYLFVFEKEGYTPWRYKVEFSAGEKATIRARMKRIE
jgi:hypothetical protein